MKSYVLDGSSKRQGEAIENFTSGLTEKQKIEAESEKFDYLEDK